MSHASSARETTGAAPPPRKGPLWARILGSDYWVLALCLAYFGGVAAILPDIATPENLGNLLSNTLPLLCVALGQTFVLITAGIDLSVTAIVALASVGGAAVMTGRLESLPASLALPAGALLMLAIGSGVGGANGLLVTRLRLPPFMVTLTMMMFLSGLAVWATGSKPIRGLPEAFTALGHGGLGPLPYAALVAIPLALAAHFALGRSLFGRRLFAVGMNAKAARISGLPVERTILLAYVASGLCAAVGSILYTARLETGSPVLGQRIFLDVIGAAVIGGTSLFGGKGSVLGTTFGVLFIAVIDNSFNLLGFSSFTVLIAKGAVILGAALVDTARTRLANR
jgi:ribose transport system permease protein